MPIWYLTSNLGGTAHQGMSETDPGTEAFASPVYGWIVGTNGANLYASADAQTEVARTVFSATLQPDGSIVTTAGAGDCWVTTSTYTGTFVTGNWVVNGCARANTAAGGTSRMRVRVFSGPNQDGTSATERTSAVQVCSTITPSTTVTNNSTVTFSLTGFTVSSEYIFIQVGWETVTAGGGVTVDVNFRVGNSAGLGSRVISAPFSAMSSTGVATATATGKSTAKAGASSTGSATATMTGSSTTAAAWYQYQRGITTGAVFQWDDQSGYNHPLQQGNATFQPVVQPDGSILFDGIDDFLVTASFTLNQPFTAYMLMRQETWVGANRFLNGANLAGDLTILQTTASPKFSGYAGSGPAAENSNLAVGAYGVVSVVFNGASSAIQVDSNAATTGDFGTNNAGGLTLAANFAGTAGWSKIRVKELIVYTLAHDATARQVVIDYLTAQMGGGASSAGVSTGTMAGVAAMRGAATSTGVATAIVTGKSNASGDASSTGIASPIVVGQSKASGAASSTGVANPIVTGKSLASAPIASTGAATGTLAGQAAISGALSSAGIATGVVTGKSNSSGNASSTGQATPIVTGQSRATGDISSTGQATGIVASKSGVAAAISSVGVATAVLSGAGTNASAIASAGIATGIGEGKSLAAANASSVGAATGTEEGKSLATADANASGSATAIMDGASSSPTAGAGDAYSAGAATGTMTGQETVAAAASSAGTSTGAFVGAEGGARPNTIITLGAAPKHRRNRVVDEEEEADLLAFLVATVSTLEAAHARHPH